MRRSVVVLVAAFFMMANGAAVIEAQQTPASGESTPTRGLGLTLKAWEKLYGKMKKDDPFYRNYWGDPKVPGTIYKYSLMLVSGHISWVEYNFPEERLVGAEEATEMATALIPTDSIVLQETTTRTGSPMVVYQSEWLTSVFPADAWKDDIPGSFVVIYESDPAFGDPGIWGFIIALGSTD